MQALVFAFVRPTDSYFTINITYAINDSTLNIIFIILTLSLISMPSPPSISYQQAPRLSEPHHGPGGQRMHDIHLLNLHELQV